MDVYHKLFKLLSSPALLFVEKQGDFVLRDFNQSYVSLTNNSCEKLPGLNLQEIINNLSIEESYILQIKRKMLHAIAADEPAEFTVKKLTKNNTTPDFNSQTLEFIPLGADESTGENFLLMVIKPIIRQKEKINAEQDGKFRSIYENSLDAVLFTVPDGRILAANPEACRMFQRTEEELCAVGREGVVDLSDPRLSKALEQRKATGKLRSELTYIRKDGSKFPVEVTSSVFTNADAEERSCIIIRDVTHQKQAEKELRKSREKYQLLFDHSPLPNWIYDNESLCITEVNRAAIEQYGYSREEFLNLKITDLRIKEEVPDFLNIIKKFQDKDGVAHYGKSKHITKEGSLRTTDIWAYRFKSTGSTLVVSQDLTKWEQMQEDLRDKSAKLLTAQKIGRFGYWELDFNKNTHYWSDEVYEIWGRDKNFFQFGPQSFYETVYPDDLEAVELEQKKAFEGKKELDFEHRILLPDQKVKWIRERGHVINDNLGNIVGFQGSVQDITDYKKAIEKLQISEARQASLLQSQTTYLIRSDLKGHYSYCNEKFHNDFSWIFPDGEILGGCATATFKDYHHNRVEAVFNQCISNPNKVHQVEIDKIQEGDEVKSTLWDFICLTNANGDPLEVQGVGIDITNRVKAEQEVKDANRRYEFVTKATSDAIWDWNNKTNTLFWGEGFRELFGYDPVKVKPNVDMWFNLIHPEDALKVRENLDQRLDGDKDNWTDEYRFKRANGEYAYVRDRSYIIRDQRGRPVRMVGAMQDVTQQKHSLQKLVQSEDEQRRLTQEKDRMLESIGDAFFTLDHEWVVTYWNSEAERVLECSKNVIIGRKLLDFFDIRNTPFETNYVKAVQERKTQNFEAYFEGTKSWYDVSAYPSTDGLSIFFRDVTDLKESNFKLKELNKNLNIYTKELITANKGLEQFSYIVSHNLRAPVANIMGLANLLESEDYPEDVQKEIMDGLTDNVKRLDKVMFDLNHILQVKNEFSQKKESVNLQKLVLSIKSSLLNVIKKEEVEINTDFTKCSELTTVAGYIHSIFYNLIFNSIKYRRSGVKPILNIKTELIENKILILFEDNGMGIDLKKRKGQIFGLYKRFHDHVEGKGMGLFMVKTQVEMLGGKISVESVVGSGTIFTIELNDYNIKCDKERDETIYSS